VAGEVHCAACGKAVRKSAAVKLDIWGSEGVAAFACSKECAKAYADGAEPPSPAVARIPREDVVAVGLLGLAAAGDIARLVLDLVSADPLGAIVPWAVRVANAVIWIALAVGLVLRRPMARWATLIAAGIVTVAHLAAATGSSDYRFLLVPASVTVPLVMILIGTADTARLAFVGAAALILPAFIAWQASAQITERRASLARIEAMSLPGTMASSGPDGVRFDLPDGWRALRRENGIVDWPHSEVEVIHLDTGAVGFVVLNPGCDRDSLEAMQERSLAALVQAGGRLTIAGISTIDGGSTEIRVTTKRGRLDVSSFELFRTLEPVGADEQSVVPGCVWLHCLAPPRSEDLVQQACRRMIGRLRRGE
jgi:hypothetical protein